MPEGRILENGFIRENLVMGHKIQKLEGDSVLRYREGGRAYDSYSRQGIDSNPEEQRESVGLSPGRRFG